MSESKTQGILEALSQLSPEQAIVLIALVVVSVLLAMVWRAWTYHYPSQSEKVPKSYLETGKKP